MNRTLFSLTLFSFLSLSFLHAEDSSSEKLQDIVLLEDLNVEIEDEESFAKDILSAEEDIENLDMIEAAPPQLSTKLALKQEDESAFTSFEEPEEPVSSLTLEPSDPFAAENDILEDETAFDVTASKGMEINLIQVFAASPFIYSLLLTLSLSSIAIWLYSLSRLKSQTNISLSLQKDLEDKLKEHQFEDALCLCKNKETLLSKLIATALSTKNFGFQSMMDSMKSEGKRATLSSWQRLGMLQDIAIIAPMLGLLGTVLGMFYAFYDLNRSFESVANLFDGFGIAVGTTVAGIGVAILAMILHSVIKFRLIQSLAKVESAATDLVRCMNSNHQ